jgi:hypothetical protein
MGAGTVSVGVHGSHTDMGAVKVKFDLSNEADKEAYNTYVNTGEVPAAKLDDVISQTTGYSNNTGTDVAAFGGSLAMDNTVGETTTLTEGHKVETATGTESMNLTVPFLGHYNNAQTLEATEVDDTERLFVARTDFDTNSALDAAKGLARATGTEYNPHIEGETTGSGDWSVTETFTDQQVQDYVSLIQAGDFDARSGTDAINNDFAVALAEDIKNAGDDQDAIRLALARYVAEGGTDAFSQMRANMGAPDQHVQLEGDEYFTGLDGHLQMEQRVKALESQAANPGSDVAVLSAEARILRAELNEKLGVITDYSKYRELPNELRVTEEKRTKGMLARVEAARNQLSGVNATAESGLDAQSPSTQDQVPGASQEQADLAGNEQLLAELKGRCATNETAARKSRWVHNGAWSMTAARSELGHTSWFGDGEEAGAYASADAAYAAASASRAKAVQLESKLDRLNPADGDLKPRVAASRAACQAWSMASTQYLQAEQGYQAIRSRHEDHPNMWAGYDAAMPPGQSG